MGLCPKPRFILFYAKKNEPRKGAPKGTEFLTALQSASGEFVQTRFAQTRTNFNPLQLPSSPKLANRGE